MAAATNERGEASRLGRPPLNGRQWWQENGCNGGRDPRWQGHYQDPQREKEKGLQGGLRHRKNGHGPLAAEEGVGMAPQHGSLKTEKEGFPWLGRSPLNKWEKEKGCRARANGSEQKRT